jgi:hypothetical protein
MGPRFVREVKGFNLVLNDPGAAKGKAGLEINGGFATRISTPEYPGGPLENA